MTLQEAMEEVSEACRDMGCEYEWKFILDHIQWLETERADLSNMLIETQEQLDALWEQY